MGQNQELNPLIQEARKIYYYLIDNEKDLSPEDTIKRVQLVRYLEKIIGTEFRSTEDFHQKIQNFLEGYKDKPAIRLKRARKKLKLNQAELASLLNCSQKEVNEMEQGKSVLTHMAIEFIDLVEKNASKGQILAFFRGSGRP